MLTSINSEFGNRLKKIVIILLGLLTSMVSLQNDYFFQQQYIAQKPWKYVDQILNNVYFKELSPNTILLAPKLFITHGNVDISGIENYWTRYIEYKIQKKLIIKERLVLEDFSQDSKVYQLAFGFENSWNEINNNHQFSNKLLFLQGMSAIENGMLWTDNTNAELFFKELLPKEFILTIASNGAFGPNGGALFKVKVGGDEKIFEGPGGMSTINLKFKPHFATNVISINIPTPTAPSEISDSKDHRLLGLSITGVKINRLDNEIKLLLGY